MIAPALPIVIDSDVPLSDEAIEAIADLLLSVVDAEDARGRDGEENAEET